jgi:hypothetical protein
MRDLINSRFGGVMGRKLVVCDAPDPIVPKRSAPRYGVKVANTAAAHPLVERMHQLRRKMMLKA